MGPPPGTDKGTQLCPPFRDRYTCLAFAAKTAPGRSGLDDRNRMSLGHSFSLRQLNPRSVLRKSSASGSAPATSSVSPDAANAAKRRLTNPRFDCSKLSPPSELDRIPDDSDAAYTRFGTAGSKAMECTT